MEIFPKRLETENPEFSLKLNFRLIGLEKVSVIAPLLNLS